MRRFFSCHHEGGSAGRPCVALVAALIGCLIVLSASDATAQGLDECPDTEIASALDNYRLAWIASKGHLGAERATQDKPRAPDLPGTFWERVTDEARDGADSLRSGTVGDNEHAELTARIAGGTTVSFWWKVDSQELADYLTFFAEPEIEAGAADGPSAPPTITVDPIAGKRDWTKVEVFLPGETAYRARWSYVKDNSGRAGADAGWIDDVRVEGPGYGEIQIEDKAEGDLVTLSWPTLPCRHYQIEWRPKDRSLPWQFSRVELATGAESWFEERASLHADRDYRVTLIEPPSFTRTPPRDFAEKEGDSLTLKYEAEGSGEIGYAWRFRGPGVDRPTLLSSEGDGREIVSAGKGSTLHIDSLREEHEGEYIVVAENKAGREPAPPVSVAVFQPPRLEAFVVRAGEEPEDRIALDAPGTPLPPELPVNAGERLQIEPEVAGSGSIRATWERQDPESGEWQNWSEGEDPRLRIEQAAPEHAGLYRLELEHKNWGKWEGPRVVEVDIISPPTNLCVRAEGKECLAEGDRLEVNQFEPLTLSVEAEGTPEFTYQWYRTDDPIPQEEGGQSPALSVATEQAGISWYQVQVTNDAGFLDTEQFEITVTSAKPNNVRIAIRGTPTVTDRNWIQTRQFDPLQLSVEADGAGEFRYQWYRSSEFVPEALGGKSATVTVATDQVGKHIYHVDVANDIDTATSETFEIRVSICPDRLFQGSTHLTPPPKQSGSCSLKAALQQANSIAWDEAVKRNAPPIDDPETWEHELISLAYLSLGDTAEAISRVRYIEPFGIRERTYRRISDWLAQRGNYTAALEATLRIDTVPEQIDTFNQIAAMQTASGFEQKAQVTFGKAIQTAQNLLNDMERYRALGDIAVARAKARDLNGALNTVAQIEVVQEQDDLPSFRDGVLFSVVDALAKVGDLELAERASAQVEHVQTRAVSLIRVAFAHAYAGHEAEAMAILERAKSVADNIKEETLKFDALAQLLAAQYGLGDGEKAEQTLETMLQEAINVDDLEVQHFGWVQDSAWFNIAVAKATIMGRNISEALDAADRFIGREAYERDSSRVEMVWLALIQYLVQKDDIAEALEVSQQMRGHSHRTTLAALGIVARAQSRSGNREGTRSTFARMLDIISNIEDVGSRRFESTNLLSIQSTNGFIEEALWNANKRDRTRAYDPYRAIGRGILYAISDENVKVGNIVTAIDAAHEIADYSARIAILAGIAALSGRTMQ